MMHTRYNTQVSKKKHKDDTFIGLKKKKKTVRFQEVEDVIIFYDNLAEMGLLSEDNISEA